MPFVRAQCGAPAGSCPSSSSLSPQHPPISSSSSSYPSQYTPSHGMFGPPTLPLTNALSSFYCIILLTTLFISTCYWPPISVDTLLTTPWAQNITTFGDALRATLASNYTDPIPPVMRPLDRCWCDLSTGGLFEPYNISQWEVLSVKKQCSILEREQILENARHPAKPEEESNTFFISDNYDDDDDEEEVVSSVPTDTSPASTAGFWSRLNLIARGPPLQPKYQTPPPTPHQQQPRATSPPQPQENRMTDVPSQVPSSSNTQQPLIRPEYDLRPYGLGMIVDLRWS